jgi:hypothetical protein
MEITVGKEEFQWGGATVKESETEKFVPSEFVKNYRTQASRAASAGSKIADKFVELMAGVLGKFMEFSKQAIEIAISKFLVELCAMIIAGISAALMNKHGRGVDISTPGVFYNKSGVGPAASPAASSPQQPLWNQGSSSNNSPFDSGWNRSSASAW